MTTYCWRCRTCGDRWSGEPVCTDYECTPDVVRDYKAENAGFNAGTLRRLREHGGSERGYARNFLPSADDYKSASDPDGEKGLRRWNDEHQPHSSASGRMIRPEGKRQAF
jgi:hypothetical protein